jgi:hypothetical protein
LFPPNSFIPLFFVLETAADFFCYSDELHVSEGEVALQVTFLCTLAAP